MAKMCKHFKKDKDCENFNKYGRYGCPVNTTESCYIKKDKKMEPVNTHTAVIKVRERAERIANSKMCFELTNDQRKMLSDEITHACMLSAFDAMEEITRFINSHNGGKK